MLRLRSQTWPLTARVPMVAAALLFLVDAATSRLAVLWYFG